MVILKIPIVVSLRRRLLRDQGGAPKPEDGAGGDVRALARLAAAELRPPPAALAPRPPRPHGGPARAYARTARAAAARAGRIADR